ncbi:tRNA lysidine(34) synthetase TilS [Pseudorhodoferax sp. Leaf267]|uniref:tRNA lysidine(34) synthetase TilS n=1 Tax=Pseudorhodoferax sp. Leaf267 TaxID=1736316 RepID=UPI0007010C3B|nr:tRNA lysidine(34) synthetase TilS [Pseudorhodoferax sp. Leaf267]KQP15020.1 tRNA(Ile)-lysidine synthetase [Pseudorhodoferax sp. Leaf267]
MSGFAAAIAAFAPRLPLAVAYSGGADSTALLRACAARWPGQVHAVHVHHGLQAAADDFESHCRSVCAALGVPLVVAHVQARHASGQSPEDAARRARYAAIAEVAARDWAQGGPRDVALAQHADDQVETMLLALSRGAGLPGLAAMPAQWERDGLRYHRPLLAVPGPDLRAWLAEQGVTWIEDPTNADAAFTRNRIRAQLLPTLARAFPSFRATFARSAGHAAQGQALLRELAETDLHALGVPPTIAGLRALSRARRANVLRHWLVSVHATAPSTAQLDELLDQLEACRTRGHDIRLKVGARFVRRRGDVLDCYNPALSDST